MDAYSAIITFMIGLLLRFVLPVGGTILMILVLRHWDQRWQQEAQDASMHLTASNIGCWEINKCPEENLAKCEAYAKRDIPCWQVFRDGTGRLQEQCLDCEVFRRAPVPAELQSPWLLNRTSK